MNPDRRRLLKREDALLLISAVALGLGGAAVFAAYRTVSASSEGGSRAGDFAANMAWPGVLIFLAVAAVVWFGWKAELD